MRITGTRTGATVRVGRKSVPYAGAVDFGGWPKGREYVAGGRYLFPAAQGLAETVANLYSDGIQQALDSFPWSNETTDAGAVHD